MLFFSGETEDSLQIDFDDKQKAVAPGQVAAIYDGERCLGSGTILRAT